MIDGIAKFISEAGVLKLFKRTGYWMEGIKDPESIAEHSFRSMIIGYFLAKMENADENKVIKMLLFHDLSEARTGDPNAVTRRYIDFDKIEGRVISDQTSKLPGDMRDEIKSLVKEFNEIQTKEAMVAKDADNLELLTTAKEYADAGYRGIGYWEQRNSLLLRTESAKKLHEELKKLSVGDWWRGLEKIHHLDD